MGDFTKQILSMKETIRRGELKKVEYVTKMEATKEKLVDAESRCHAYGLEPGELPARIEQLEHDMNVILQEVNQLLAGISA